MTKDEAPWVHPDPDMQAAAATRRQEARDSERATLDATGDIHKAELSTARGAWLCAHCGREIKRVPGGDGPVWVHADTGAVVGTGPPQPKP